MRRADLRGRVQVRDGARDPQDTVISACRKPKLINRALQKRGRTGRGATMRIDFGCRQRRVCAPRACFGARSCTRNARSHLFGAFGGVIGVHEHLPRDGCHTQVHIDTVQQRAGDLGAITGDAIGRAVTTPRYVALITTRTGVHGRNELKRCRELGLAGRARDHDMPGLQRLAQHFQHLVIKLGQLVEKQHAAMRQRDLARLGGGAAAHQRHTRGRMMRAAKRPAAERLGIEGRARYRGNGRHIQRVGARHDRQQPRQPLGQHGLARARRANHQQRMAAGGCDFQRTPRLGLAAHVGHIGHGSVDIRRRRGRRLLPDRGTGCR